MDSDVSKKVVDNPLGYDAAKYAKKVAIEIPGENGKVVVANISDNSQTHELREEVKEYVEAIEKNNIAAIESIKKNASYFADKLKGYSSKVNSQDIENLLKAHIEAITTYQTSVDQENSKIKAFIKTVSQALDSWRKATASAVTIGLSDYKMFSDDIETIKKAEKSINIILPSIQLSSQKIEDTAKKNR